MAQNRQLAAIMFSDIQGYTSLMQLSESEALKVREKHRRVVDEITEKYKGKIINYFGDGNLSIFDSAVDAVNCGYELQQRFLEPPFIPVRIGIHIGDIVIIGDDIIGNSVNIASRIGSLGIVGSVLFSEKVKEEISNQDNLQFKDVGTYHLKNDRSPRRIFALDMPGVNVPDYGNLHGKTKKEASVKESTKSQISIKYLNKNKRLLIPLLSIMLIIIIGVIGYRLYTQKKMITWAREVALPQIEQFQNERKFYQAFQLASQVKKFLKKDSGLERLWPHVSQQVSLDTKPSGAKVFRKTYEAPADTWEFIGTTPLQNISTYAGPSLWKFQKDGFYDSQRLIYYNISDYPTIKLDSLGTFPAGMVRIDGNSTDLEMITGVNSESGTEQVKSFLMDRFEVSNAEYQKFVDAGGYRNSKFWKILFAKNGKQMTDDQIIESFKDKTGNAGPANWELSEFPKGMDNYPVTGISWYEAAAYAEYANKDLPTLFHWDIAADIWLSNMIVTNSNIQKKALAPVGSYDGITSSGIYDIAGNVKEWIWNGNNLNNHRYILGGAYNDPTYSFNEARTLNPYDRSLTNGFRCIKYLESNENQDKLLANTSINQINFYVGAPVSDEVLKAYAQQFAFEKIPFNAKVEPIHLPYKNRTCEKVTFDAAYGGVEMSAYLYLPVNAKPPYQTIVFFTSGAAIWDDEFDPVNDRQLHFVDFLLKSGRAIIIPMLKSAFDRQDGMPNSNPSSSVKYRDHVIYWCKDIIRTVDFLETRTDIDMEKIAYQGFSWGARLGGIILAIEPRFKAAVLVAGGLSSSPPMKEVSEYIYLPRVTLPVLMLNGLHDLCCFPVETAQKPFFNLLGTVPEDKKHVLFENSAHLPARADVINETLNWYDKYLGKPGSK